MVVVVDGGGGFPSKSGVRSEVRRTWGKNQGPGSLVCDMFDPPHLDQSLEESLFV